MKTFLYQEEDLKLLESNRQKIIDFQKPLNHTIITYNVKLGLIYSTSIENLKYKVTQAIIDKLFKEYVSVRDKGIKGFIVEVERCNISNFYFLKLN